MPTFSIATRATLALGAALIFSCAPESGKVGSPSDGGSVAMDGSDARADAVDAGGVIAPGLDAGEGDASTSDAEAEPGPDASGPSGPDAESPSGADAMRVAGLDAAVAPGLDAAVLPGPDATIAAGLDAAALPGLDAAAMPGLDAAVAPGPDAGLVLTPAEQAACNTLVTDLQSELAAGFTPGGSFAVVLHGRLACTGVAGVRDVASGAPVTTATMFRADSMSKMVLAATAMSLVRDGALDLQAPITTYLPWFNLAAGFDASTISTEQLLTHTSGFPCDTINQCGSSMTLGPREAFFRNYPQPLWAPPGAVFDYSNVGYVLASQVLTAAAGVTDPGFEQLVHDRVFVPAGMTTATYDAAAAALGDAATDYLLNSSGGVITHRSVAWGDCPMLHPSGGVIATPTDYAHFAEMLLANGGAALDPVDVIAMEASHVGLRSRPTQSYGYGLLHEFSPYPTHASVWHDGELPGSYALTYLVPDRQFAVVVMVNATGPRPVASDVVSDALALFIPDPRSVPSGWTNPATWGPYVGTYDDHHGTLGTGVVVSLSGSTLSINAPNATDMLGHAVPVQGAMTQVATDTFLLPDGSSATFFPDGTGVFRYLVARRGIATR